ncbi:MAG: 5'/3'-nucleotidase SurE [Nitrospinae bacterium]|nr:5'/3'-nucleotidase SurE [Nitrospinota bacterium]
MRVLISNDDGINAPGLRALQKGFSAFADARVAAPETERSAVGHAITIANPLRVREVTDHGKKFGWAIDGTPADCVKIALKALLNKKPDILVSGVNHGANLATNVIYSGTVSAATEGTILGIPSIAVSLCTWEKNADFSSAVKYGVEIAKVTVKNGLPRGTLLNVNVPSIPEGKIKGIKVCRQSNCIFEVGFDKRSDLRGMDYYWQGGKMQVDDPDKSTDIMSVEDGWVTITPIQYDLTNHSFLEELASWKW